VSLLKGKSILLLEDEFLIAVNAEALLHELGAANVRTESTVAGAIAALGSHPVDAALVDVNIDGVQSVAIAEALAIRGVPFIYATGYGELVIDLGPAAPVLDKPYDKERVAEAFAQLWPADGDSIATS
jgi:CheY-like chemotaxis protein